ncbi:MAG TPA: helix-turn-helix domain-containing protein [Steroidobacteraceae bacterium]|nr:helix-turn-helix domain-containing protein [Steroidobacteraceae bacterium]
METSPHDPLAVVLLTCSLSSAALPPLIDAEQAAKMLGCSKEHVEALADRGALPATKYGRGWIFVTAQLIHHVAQDCAKNVGTRDAAPRPERRVKRTPKDNGPAQSAPETEPGGSLPLEPRGPAKSRGRPRLSVPDLTPRA